MLDWLASNWIWALGMQDKMSAIKAPTPTVGSKYASTYASMPNWYNTQHNQWLEHMEAATKQKELRASPTYPSDGDIITRDSIMALVRKALEDGVAKAVVTCKHCGQWAARFCECKKCGAPVD